METQVEFCLLGPLMVRYGAAAVPVPQGKQRTMLAALLLNAGQVVSVHELVDALWGASPPSSARVSAQNYIMRLRKALEMTGPRIVTQPHGYLIRVDTSELDVSRFASHLETARTASRNGSWQAAAAEARAGLSLWRGEPLADIDSELLATRDAPRLAEMRLQALETRIDADLHLGRHPEVIIELRRLAEDHPLRERLHGLLMLALYRDGRQAEALAAYQQARKILVDELGAEPGAPLQELHRQILSADPSLATPEAASLTGPGPAAAPPATPRQLPPGVLHFTGRARELAVLTELMDKPGNEEPGTVVISAIGGTAGVGKTALAVHWAHQAAHRFADGQLYVNLRGFDPAGAPAAPAEAVRGFLDALGIAPERIPVQPDAQAALYRSLVADKQLLIVLDNAQDEQQVRPLLPASPRSLVIITSRNELSGLAATDDARLLSLDVLTRDEANQMLTARIGSSRADAEREAITEVADLCACLPLGLAVAAARAAARPGFRLATLAVELRSANSRLHALDSGDPMASVQAVFSWSYQQLGADTARMFRLLGLHPGPDISVPAAASLAAVDVPQAGYLLRELTRAHLIIEHTPGRYAFHDLLRAYAAGQTRTHDSAPERDAAISRVFDHYLHTADRAARFLNNLQEPVALLSPKPGAVPEECADDQQAMAWFEAEHHVLLAVVALAAGSGADSHAWQLPHALMPFLVLRGHYQEWAGIQRIALAAATHHGDTTGQAISSRLLALACSWLGDFDQAHAHAATSIALYQQASDRLGEAGVHRTLSVTAGRQRRYAEALGHAEQALGLYQAIGHEEGEASALGSVGWFHAVLGDYKQARAFSRRSIALSAEAGQRRLEAYALDNLGYAEHHLGNLGEAAACYQRALRILPEFGDRYGEATTLAHLGDTWHAAGDLPQARDAWQQALTIFDDLQLPDADEVRAKLASTDSR